MNAYYYFKDDSYGFLIRLLDVKESLEYNYYRDGKWMNNGYDRRDIWNDQGFLRQSKLIYKKSIEEAKAHVEYMFLEYKL